MHRAGARVHSGLTTEVGEGLAAALHPEAPGRGSAGVARRAAFRDPPRARWERAGHELKRNRGRTNPPGLASPRLTLDGEGGTNQRATFPFRFQAPDAVLTPRAPRSLIGCARRRSRPEAGGGAPRLPAPRSAPGPARGARPPSVPAVLPPSSVRARSAGVPHA